MDGNVCTHSHTHVQVHKRNLQLDHPDSSSFRLRIELGLIGNRSDFGLVGRFSSRPGALMGVCVIAEAAGVPGGVHLHPQH